MLIITIFYMLDTTIQLNCDKLKQDGRCCHIVFIWFFVAVKLNNCWKGTVLLFILQKKILLVSKPREKLRDARNISAHDDINIPKITQPYTRLILVHIFYCASQMPSPPPMMSKTSQMQTIQSDAASRYFSIHSKVAVPST